MRLLTVAAFCLRQLALLRHLGLFLPFALRAIRTGLLLLRALVAPLLLIAPLLIASTATAAIAPAFAATTVALVIAPTVTATTSATADHLLDHVSARFATNDPTSTWARQPANASQPIAVPPSLDEA